MNYQHNIRVKVKKKMREENITQKELAKKLKINDATFNRYLNGQRGFSLLMTIKFADYLGISLDELVGRV